MIQHRFRLEREQPEGYWTILGSADARSDAVWLSEDYQDLTMRIVDMETGEITHLRRHHHKGKRHEMAYRTSW